MKLKATTKDLRNARNLIACGYCELQRPLRAYSPTAYTSGVYGWKADVYVLDNFTLVTGYDTPRFARGIPYDVIEQINAAADWYNLPDEEARVLFEQLLNEFLGETK